MPDPKKAKFRDFYPDDFGQILSGCWLSRQNPQIFIRTDLRPNKNHQNLKFSSIFALTSGKREFPFEQLETAFVTFGSYFFSNLLSKFVKVASSKLKVD